MQQIFPAYLLFPGTMTGCIWQRLETLWGFPGDFPEQLSGTESACQYKRHRRLPSLGREDPWEKVMSTHTSILAWEIQWAEEPGGLQSQSIRPD